MDAEKAALLDEITTLHGECDKLKAELAGLKLENQILKVELSGTHVKEPEFRAEPVKNGLSQIYLNGIKQNGLYTLAEAAQIYDNLREEQRK